MPSLPLSLPSALPPQRAKRESNRTGNSTFFRTQSPPLSSSSSIGSATCPLCSTSYFCFALRRQLCVRRPCVGTLTPERVPGGHKQVHYNSKHVSRHAPAPQPTHERQGGLELAGFLCLLVRAQAVLLTCHRRQGWPCATRRCTYEGATAVLVVAATVRRRALTRSEAFSASTRACFKRAIVSW